MHLKFKNSDGQDKDHEWHSKPAQYSESTLAKMPAATTLTCDIPHILLVCIGNTEVHHCKLAASPERMNDDAEHVTGS